VAIAIGMSNVTKHHAANVVLAGVSLEIQDGEVIGLVGPNGAGKSTLFKLLTGEYDIDDGVLNRRRGLRVGYLPQDPELGSGTVIEELLTAHDELAAVDRDLRQLEQRMADPAVLDEPDTFDRVLERHAEALERFDRLGGHSFRGLVEGTLRRLGFSEAEFDTPVAVLSGGQKKLLGLGKVLVTEPDVLLLDEPDNHLDIEGKRLLERVIVDHRGSVVIISHDRYLLDIVADSIAELEMTGQHPGRSQLVVFPGNYSEYAYQKRMELEGQQHDFAVQQVELNRLEKSIARLKVFSRGGANEKFVRRWKSMQKRLDKVERIEAPMLDPKRMSMELRSERGSKKVLELAGLWKQFDDNVVLGGLDLVIWAGERVALIGPNGAGKSVLVRIVLGELEATEGTAKLGPSVDVAYYAQQHETLDYNSTPIEEIRRLKPMREEDAIAFLSTFLFDHPRAQRRIALLSGGEKSRLQLAKLMLAEANLLILDEPTNNLDIPSAEVLEDALDAYKGTILAVSHDRYFLERIAARLVELKDAELTEYLGGYTAYREGNATETSTV